MSVSYRSAEEGALSGEFRYVDADALVLGCSYMIASEATTYTDEDSRNHELQDWTVEVKSVEDASNTFQPITAKVKIHCYSKMLNDQATTLEVAASINSTDSEILLAGRFRTTTPWEIAPTTPSSAIDLGELDDAEKLSILYDLLQNGLAVINTIE